MLSCLLDLFNFNLPLYNDRSSRSALPQENTNENSKLQNLEYVKILFSIFYIFCVRSRIPPDDML